MRIAALFAILLVAAGAGPATKRSPKPATTRSTTPTAPVTPATPHDPVREAFAHATAPALGDTSRARLNAFITRHAHHPLAREAWLELGTLNYALGEYAAARDDFRRARGGAVADRARLWEARALLALGAPREARSLVQPLARAKQPTATRWEASEIVAMSLTNEAKRPNALAAYRALLDDPPGPGEAAALFQAIELADEAGDAADSREWRQRLLGFYPRSPEAASARAKAEVAPPADKRDAPSTRVKS